MSLVYPKYICEVQSYYVKLDVDGVEMSVFVEVENELEMSRKEIIERAFLNLSTIPTFKYVQFLPEVVKGVEVFEKKYAPLPKHYKLQSYLVKFDTNTPVDITANVYHSDVKEELTREEIIQEAIEYLEDIGIKNFRFEDVYEIETLELEEASSPIAPYMQTHVLEEWELAKSK